MYGGNACPAVIFLSSRMISEASDQNSFDCSNKIMIGKFVQWNVIHNGRKATMPTCSTFSNRVCFPALPKATRFPNRIV